jgi:hypothetical protein
MTTNMTGPQTSAGSSKTDVAREEAGKVAGSASDKATEVAQTAMEQAKEVAADAAAQARTLAGELRPTSSRDSSAGSGLGARPRRLARGRVEKLSGSRVTSSPAREAGSPSVPR